MSLTHIFLVVALVVCFVSPAWSHFRLGKRQMNERRKSSDAGLAKKMRLLDAMEQYLVKSKDVMTELIGELKKDNFEETRRSLLSAQLGAEELREREEVSENEERSFLKNQEGLFAKTSDNGRTEKKDNGRVSEEDARAIFGV